MTNGGDEQSEGAAARIATVAIQGERGSNSHMAALAMLGDVELVPCAVSADVVDAVVSGRVDAAVLPIENSLHGSVAEHFDLLMAQPVRIERESLLRIRHNLIAAPGVRLEDVRTILSHPVALSQCRRFLATMEREHGARSSSFYDTAGSVKEVVGEGLRDAAGIAPELAAKEYGGVVLVAGVEDHVENFTRFHLLRSNAGSRLRGNPVNKVSVGFALDHRPGSLVAALSALAGLGVDLTQIESRPVPGKPWEYLFYVDLRVSGEEMADAAVAALRVHGTVVKELGRYAEAEG